MMTPIHRIPTEGMPLETVVTHEMGRAGTMHEQIAELLSHTDDTDHISCTLDWAMQIRDTFGFDWAECISIAMTLYFG